MTANISFNKRNYEAVQADVPRKAQRSVKTPIDPKLILAQGNLIRLAGEVRYQFFTGFTFEKVASNSTISKVLTVLSGDGTVIGYIKALKNPTLHNNAIIEKIRWDLAVLAGDYSCHAPTQISLISLPQQPKFVFHVQPHIEGEPVTDVFEKKGSIPKRALLKSLIMTVVYGGFDDHFNNLMYQESKIVHFDNAGSFPYGSKFIFWSGLHLLSFRPVVLRFKEMGEELTPEEIAFIKRELLHYQACLPKFRTYFNRIDIKKMIGRGDMCLINTEKSLLGMQERITLALAGLEDKKPFCARSWIFSSFPFFRVATALSMVENNKKFEKAILHLNEKGLLEVLRGVAKKGKNPIEVIKMAIEHDDIEKMSDRLFNELPYCDLSELERGLSHAVEFIESSSEIEFKNDGTYDIKLVKHEVLAELLKKGVKLHKNEVDVFWEEKKLVIRQDKTIVLVYPPFCSKPLSIDEFVLMAHGALEEPEIKKFNEEMKKHTIPVASGFLHSLETIKVSMSPNTYRVFQVIGGANDRFFVAEKDNKGNVYSRGIEPIVEKVLEIKERYRLLNLDKSIIKISELRIDSKTFAVFPGNCAGTFLLRVGKLFLPPMYKHEIEAWVKGEKRELELLNALNGLNVCLGLPILHPLKEGEYLLHQEKDASPPKITIYQRPYRYPSVNTYHITGEYERGLRVISERGEAFFIDRKTLIFRLKNGLKLDGDPHAGTKS